MNLLNDISYNRKYVELYLKENEEIFEFKYKQKNWSFYNISIKRPILKVGNIEIKEKIYDLESAYGYGGFVSNTNDKSFINDALEKYKKECQKQNIIAEFMRFHPFNEFSKEVFDFCILDRNVIIKNLKEDIMSSYVSKVRNIVKNSLKKLEIIESRNIDKFIELYYYTMQKNSADNFYFFKKNYFNNLLNLENVKLYEVKYNDEIIAMAFFIFSEFGYYHLSANSELSYKLNANYALLHKGFEEAKNLGIEYFILGGGLSGDENDSLYKFKKKFSKTTKPFYIAGNIYDKEKYDYLNNLWLKQSKQDIKYFLKYRLEIK